MQELCPEVHDIAVCSVLLYAAGCIQEDRTYGYIVYFRTQLLHRITAPLKSLLYEHPLAVCIRHKMRFDSVGRYCLDCKYIVAYLKEKELSLA